MHQVVDGSLCIGRHTSYLLSSEEIDGGKRDGKVDDADCKVHAERIPPVGFDENLELCG